MNKIKLIALCGESGVGKDYIMRQILKSHPELHEIVSHTSRPMREGEEEGINYYYCSDEEFQDKILMDEMLEFSVFNNWFYGTAFDSLSEEKVNIGVFNPEGIRSLEVNKDYIDTLIIRVCASQKTRLLRALNREENPDVNEIVRRFQTDEEDFYQFDCEIQDYKNVYELWNDTNRHDIFLDIDFMMQTIDEWLTSNGQF